MNRITFTNEAADDIDVLRIYDQRRILQAIEAQLVYQADLQSRNRKRLRPNRLAEWELRVGEFRVFYDVDSVQAVTKVIAIGYKHGSKLYVRGKEYEL